MLITPGVPALLSLQLTDRATDLGILARVFKSNGDEVPGSPFALSHVNQGLYLSEDWTPQESGNYVARFEAYTDDSYAEIAPDRSFILRDVTVLKNTGLSGEVDKGH